VSVHSRTLTLLAALPLALGLSGTAAHAAPLSSSVPTAATTGSEWGGYENGKIPASALCAISWQTVDHLRCDAAAKFEALNTAYKATWGANICVNDAYRSYEKQVALYKQLGPDVAAVPGTSNHGWGIAVDLGCGVGVFGNARHVWFAGNAPRYGFTQPEWALIGSSRAEAWHWQFFGADLPAYLTATKAATVATAASTGTWPRTVTSTISMRNSSAVMAGVPVTITRRSVTGTTVTTVGTYRSDAAGKVAYTFYPKEPTRVTFSYAGSTGNLASTVTVTVTTPTVLTSRVNVGSPNMLRGHLVTAGGTVMAARTVYLQRRYASSSTWTTVATGTTNSYGNFWSRQQPKRATYYRFYFPGVSGQYVKDYSPSVYVAY
jgi:carbon monoxide dehydrogenase subunit G